MRPCGAATQTAPQGTLITQAGSAGVAHRNIRTTRTVHADSAETRAPSILAAFLGPDRHTGSRRTAPRAVAGWMTIREHWGRERVASGVVVYIWGCYFDCSSGRWTLQQLKIFFVNVVAAFPGIT